MSNDATILIVEDNDDDFEACMYALKNGNNLANPIHRSVTGDDAMAYLTGTGKYADPRPAPPCMILLDLNLPGTDGRDVLHRLKVENDLKKIPVIVMTGSDDQADVHECYHIGASGYVTKPIDTDGFFQSILRLHDYWLKVTLHPIPQEVDDLEW